MAYNALTSTMAWAQSFNFNRNLASAGNEPAVTSANLVKQTLLGPPFSWPWNRDVIEFSCSLVLTLTAAANASGGNTVYTGTITGGSASDFLGATFTVAGFTTSANNGSFVCVSSTTTTLTLANTAGVSETHAGTATVTPQDYVKAVSNFGWIENASVQDTSGSINKWQDLQVELDIPLDSNKSLPQNISAQLEDGAGNITFRLQPPPDAAYPVSITIQKAAVDFAATSDTWTPIPNRYAYIYNWGFLALMFLYADDPRAQMANQKFMAGILGASQGLNETQINIFLNNWQAVQGMMIANQGKAAQGIQARAI